MTLDTQPTTASKVMFWTGWVISGLVLLALIPSGIMKFMGGEELEKGFQHLGIPVKLAITLGIIELACAVVYAFPSTAVAGAILVTGYFGGAIATHLRLGEPVIVQTLIPILAWLGLFLRDGRVREILPWRS